ncbi:MAG: hypothetical protein JSU75_03555 [Gammaproteobacteria bacterium]|nr:MAG: hypothetical protein JSU75_03555 [Gammaproteobacteria bacterium]
MKKSFPGRNRQSLLEKEHAYGVIRTILVTYGVAASSYLFTQSVPEDVAPVYGGLFSPRSLVVLGLVLQVLMIGTRALIKRHVPDSGTAAQGMFILELIGDGVTVLFFALGTFGALLQMADL